MPLVKKIKSSKGSIAVYVSIVIISMLLILLALFFTSNAVRRNQLTTAMKVKETYEADNGRAAEIYESLVDSMTPPGGSVTNDGVPIPDGFYYVGGTKEEGVVISDNPADENKGTSHDAETKMQGNQFVWIPVEDESLFKRYEGYSSGKLQDGYVDMCSEPYAGGYENEEQEFNEMKARVIANKGFYVGRYEAGTTNSTRDKNSGITDQVLVQQGKYVYNYVGWNNSETNAMNDETGGAVELAKGFARANGYTSVTSTLIYGVQWDAIMAWIEPRYKDSNKAEELLSEKNYVANSTGKGYYYADAPTTTGSSSVYAVNNIYDLAGNVAEWTMESFSTGSRVYRGGYYDNSGCDYPASSRDYDGSSYDDRDDIGFRVTLYL